MKKLLLFFLFIFFWSCNSPKSHPIDFYYWRSNFNVSQIEKNVVDSLEVKNIYVRFFDVDQTENLPKPIGKIKKFDALALNVNYIPTVFITNRTFKNQSKKDVELLAKNINQLIQEISKIGKLENYEEIQIDCDWTKSTQKQYFTFLEELKKVSKKKISATLRLHQVKFKEREGIPPLDKMVLMCYATENPNDVETKNSILDLDLAKDYLNNLDQYPIKLDVALPIYSWAIIKNNLGKIKLINSFSEDDLIGKPVINKGKGLYEVVNDFFLDKFYLSKGFTIKVETISPELLQQTKSFLDQKLKYNYRIIYYHLDQKFTQKYYLISL